MHTRSYVFDELICLCKAEDLVALGDGAFTCFSELFQILNQGQVPRLGSSSALGKQPDLSVHTDGFSLQALRGIDTLWAFSMLARSHSVHSLTCPNFIEAPYPEVIVGDLLGVDELPHHLVGQVVIRHCAHLLDLV